MVVTTIYFLLLATKYIIITCQKPLPKAGKDSVFHSTGCIQSKSELHRIWSLPQKCLHKFNEILYIQNPLLLTKELSKASSCPELRLHQVIVGVVVTRSHLPSLQRTSVEQGGMETSFLPPTPVLAWLWQAGPCAFQTSLGRLKGFAMGYETLCSEATCLPPAVGTLAWLLSVGANMAYMERADRFVSDGSMLSAPGRLQAD